MAVEAEDLAARLKAEFPHALRTGQLVAYYQPEVELSSGWVVAAESLVRWEHPEFGTLPPALFTPVAEQLGLMGELTRLMLRLSLVQHRVWAAAGLFAFPSRRRTRPERLRSLPDLVIFAYPIGDLLLLFGVLSPSWRGVPQASVTPLRIFATGMLVFIAADVTYDYTTIHAPYHGGDGSAEAAGGSTRTPSRRPIPPSLSPGPGAAAGPASAVPPAWAERQVPNGRVRGPDARWRPGLTRRAPAGPPWSPARACGPRWHWSWRAGTGTGSSRTRRLRPGGAGWT
jgi:hypothetical protein